MLQRKTPLKRTPFRKKWPSEISNDTDRKKDRLVPMRRTALRKSGSDTADDLDKVFSFYIRLRDCMPGGRTRCISCGHEFPFEQMQCGHFHTRHHGSTRWDELNCSSQCYDCNCNKRGNLGKYKENLIRKIGLKAFDELNVRHNLTVKWSDSDLKDMIVDFGLMVCELSKEKGVPMSQQVFNIIKRYSK